MFDEPTVSYGRLDNCLEPNAFRESVVDFLVEQLPMWRSRPGRRPATSEGELNSQICKHLNNAARHAELPYSFHHEQLEDGGRRVDMSVGFLAERYFGTSYYTQDDPFLVFECKRLPAPSRRREREYVSSGSDEKIKGGIQRFKLGLHARRLRSVVMVGYIERDEPRNWFEKINGWINELVDTRQRHGEKWGASDILADFVEGEEGIAHARSRHGRINSVLLGEIEIRHVWIVMKWCEDPCV